MTQPASQPDGSAALSRRDLLRLGRGLVGNTAPGPFDDASRSGRAAGSSQCGGDSIV